MHKSRESVAGDADKPLVRLSSSSASDRVQSPDWPWRFSRPAARCQRRCPDVRRRRSSDVRDRSARAPRLGVSEPAVARWSTTTECHRCSPKLPLASVPLDSNARCWGPGSPIHLRSPTGKQQNSRYKK